MLGFAVQNKGSFEQALFSERNYMFTNYIVADHSRMTAPRNELLEHKINSSRKHV
jgi:hypothetical protein